MHALESVDGRRALPKLLIRDAVHKHIFRKHRGANNGRIARSVLAQHSDFHNVIPYYGQATRPEVELEKKAVNVNGRLCAEQLKVESAVASTK